MTTEAITRAAPGNVTLYYWNGTAYVASTVVVEVHGFLLNDADTVPIDTAVFVEFMLDNIWELSNGNCAVRDWE